MALYMPLVHVGTTTDLSTAPVTSLALPGDTQVGDLCTVTLLRTDGSDVTDSRFANVATWGTDAGVWVCGALPSLDPIEVTGSGNDPGRELMQVNVWSNTLSATDDAWDSGTVPPATFPAIDPQYAAVGLVLAYANGFAAFDIDDDLNGDWARMASSSGRTASAAFQWTGSTAVPPPGAIDVSVIADEWFTAIIGVELKPLAEPVRKYPRDDGLGHSSAARKFPPVKARRVFGGYN